jgi:hypothetical protein
MRSSMIFADEWQGLLAPFVRLLFAAVFVTGLILGVGLGIGAAAVLNVVVPRKRHDSSAGGHATMRRLGWIAVWGSGGLMLGLILAWFFRGDPLRGPMATATLTERAMFAICFFVPLGFAAGIAAGVASSAGDVPRKGKPPGQQN